jgi:hypothetical protein
MAGRRSSNRVGDAIVHTYTGGEDGFLVHPDHWFGAGVLHEHFPSAPVDVGRRGAQTRLFAESAGALITTLPEGRSATDILADAPSAGDFAVRMKMEFADRKQHEWIDLSANLPYAARRPI